uniref:Small ribosomal subunit protein bS18c n=1 Tax=Carex laticeps TaxID=418169 RepID=A0AAU7AM87_9POAL
MDKEPLRVRKAKRSLVRKAKQPLVGKFNNPFHKFRQDFPESKIKKIYKYIPFWKYLFLHREESSRHKYKKGPLSQRDRRFYIRSRKEIHYRNIDSISRFIGLAGRIIPRRVTKLTLRHQRLMTNAIKKARFLALLPFIENDLHFEKKWREILARRKEKKDKKKNRNKRRSIPRVPKEGINPWNRPFFYKGFKTNPKTESSSSRNRTRD